MLFRSEKDHPAVNGQIRSSRRVLRADVNGIRSSSATVRGLQGFTLTVAGVNSFGTFTGASSLDTEANEAAEPDSIRLSAQVGEMFFSVTHANLKRTGLILILGGLAGAGITAAGIIEAYRSKAEDSAPALAEGIGDSLLPSSIGAVLLLVGLIMVIVAWCRERG